MATLLSELVMDVKVFAQPLGAENNWSDLGDGVIDIRDRTVRVRPLPPAPIEADDDDGDEESRQRLQEAMLKADSDEPLLEDLITPDTQFMGRDTCIVWNSPAQELSFCVMFPSEMCYQAALSAFHFTAQCKADTESWDIDVIAPLMTATKSSAEFGELLATEMEQVAACAGFIEQHTVAMSFITGDYAGVPGVVASKRCCHAMLLLHHPALLEYILHDNHFGAFAAACDPEAASSPLAGGSGIASPAAAPTAWTVPPSLAHLPCVDQVQATVERVRRLHALRPIDGPAEANPIADVIDNVTQRQLNVLTVALVDEETGFLSALCKSAAKLATPPTVAAGESLRDHLLCMANTFALIAALHGRDGCIGDISRYFQSSNALLALAAAAQWLLHTSPTTCPASEGVARAFYRVLDETLVLVNNKGDEVAMADMFRDPLMKADLGQTQPPSRSQPGTPRTMAASAASAFTAGTINEALAPFLAFLCAKPSLSMPPAPPAAATAGGTPTKQQAKPVAQSQSMTTLATSMLTTCPQALHGAPGTVVSFGSGYLHHLLGMHDDEGTTVDRDGSPAAIESRLALHALFISRFAYYVLHAADKAGFLPEPVSNLFEYLLRLTGSKLRDELVMMLLSSQSPLVTLLLAHDGGRTKAELCANLRLTRSIVVALGCLDRRHSTPLIHRITFARDIFAAYLARLRHDRRGCSMAHSVFRSLLDAFGASSGTLGLPPAVDPLDPLRRFVLLKHRSALPLSWVQAVDASELEALARECNDDGFRSPIPFASPSRAPTPSVNLSANRTKRVAEQPLPPDEKHCQLSNKLRALVAAKQADSALLEADRAAPAPAPAGAENVVPPPTSTDASGATPLKRKPMAPAVAKSSTTNGRNKRSTSGARPGSSGASAASSRPSS